MRFITLIAVIMSLCACTTNLDRGGKTPASKAHQKSLRGKHQNAFPKRYTRADKDSAPKGPLPSFFELLKPKNEAFSRYGNPGSYTVDGRNYQVLTTSKGFKERGTASWYGNKFAKQRTSSGEHYNMYAMTAAHRTLPLPSYVRVKNLDNGREAVVRINDRGPFHSGRVIDLSYAAATKLGVLPHGTARVEIEALAGKTGKPYIARYHIQAGAFQSSRSAYDLRRKLLKLTKLPVRVEKLGAKYLVRIGPFPNQYASAQLRRQMDKQGLRGSFSVLL
jgi:rare lipoprotein A